MGDEAHAAAVMLVARIIKTLPGRQCHRHSVLLDSCSRSCEFSVSNNVGLPGGERQEQATMMDAGDSGKSFTHLHNRFGIPKYAICVGLRFLHTAGIL
jgi:hypothetical protein